MPNSCPHLEIKYFGRNVKMDSTGITTTHPGWYCIWCKQEFNPTGNEGNDESHTRPKRQNN